MLDSEGRCVILEFPAFVLIGVYVPATRDDTRTDFRMGFFSALDARIRNLVAMGKQVVLAGDLNVIRTDIDTACCAEELRKAKMTLEDFLSTPSRRFFNQLIFDGQVIGERDEGREEPVMWDVTRTFHPNREGMFTCWETKKNARPGNFGSRIDYILCTDGIKDWIEDSNIQEGLIGSDHCPVYVTFADTIKRNGADVHILDVMNPADMFKEGRRLREWSTKDLLPQSAKLLNEFDRRRNIRDMFTKKPTQSRPKGNPTTTTTADTPSNTPESSDAHQTPTVAPSSTPTAVPASANAPSSPKLESPAKSVARATPLKRPSASTTTQQNKKARSAPAKDKSKPGPSQSSLMGFFKPKSLPPSTADRNEQEDGPPTAAEEGAEQTSSPKKPSSALPRPNDAAAMSADEAEAEAIEDYENSAEGASGEDGDRVFDPIESKESWSKLLGKKRAAPPCEHGEPCISFVTKKAGFNKGAS